MYSPCTKKVAMDAACYTAAGNINREAELAVQWLKDGILMPVTHKTNFKLENRQENSTLLNSHELTVYKEGCDGCSLICCC